MAKSILKEKGMQPTDEMLFAVLGEARPLWDGVAQHIRSMGGAAESWKYYGAAWGWSLVYTCRKKTVAYLTPLQNQLCVVFHFNEQAREESRLCGLPESVLQLMEAAQSNGAGRTFDIVVADHSAIPLVKQLLEIKQKTL